MEVSPIVCWIVAGLVLAGGDILLGTFYLLVMGAACLIAAAAAWGGMTLGWQFSIFAAATILGGLAVQRLRSRKADESEALQHPDVGQSVSVLQWREDGTAFVSYRGARWSASPVRPGDAGAKGGWKIVRVEGSRLVIEPLNG